MFFDGAATRPLPRRVGNGLHGKMRRCPCPVSSAFGFHFADHSEGATAQWLHEVVDLCRCQAGTAMAQGCFGSPLKTIPRVWMSRGKSPRDLGRSKKQPAIPNLVPILAVEHVNIDLCIFTDHVMPQNDD